MKELTKSIVETLVDFPEGISIEETQGNSTCMLQLTVDKRDIGKVIGRKGRTIDSIRVILRGVGAKLKKRVILEIME